MSRSRRPARSPTRPLVSQTITAFGASAAAGDDAGVGGVATAISSTDDVEALIATGANITTDGDVTVDAENELTALSIGGGVGLSGDVGIGAAISPIVIEDTTVASIADGTSGDFTTVNSGGSVDVSATAGESGVLIAVAGAAGGDVSLAGAVAVYSVTDVTTAAIGAYDNVFAHDNVAVLADDATDLSFVAGAVSGSGDAALGASAGVAVISSTTHATIGDNAVVTALGFGTDDVAYVSGYTVNLNAYGTATSTSIEAPGDKMTTPTSNTSEVLSAADAQNEGLRLIGLARTETPTVTHAHGVVVNAADHNSIEALSAGAAVSGTGSIAVSADVPVVTTSTEALIGDSAQINIVSDGSAQANQSVTVVAASDLYHIGIAGSVAGSGTVGLGGGVEVAILSLTTKASIGDATVTAVRDVTINANADEDIVGAAASAAVSGEVALAGGLDTTVLTTDTEATIAANATVEATGNVVLNANDITRTAELAGTIAVGAGAVGAGGSIGLTDVTKDTKATIGNGATIIALGNNTANLTDFDGNGFSTTDTGARGLQVEANSNESLFTLGIAGAGGFFGGIAGVATIQLLDITTDATVGDNEHINDATTGPYAETGANAAQDVNVTARDSTSIAVDDGALSVGAVAASGAVDVGTLRNTTAASIGDNGQVDAKHNVVVAGLQNVGVDSTALSASVALAGIAAGISVYSIGDGIDPNGDGAGYLNNSSGSVGSYAQGQLNDGSVNTVLSKTGNKTAANAGQSTQDSRTAVNVGYTQSGPVHPAGTLAHIGSSGIGASGAIDVQSRDTLNSQFVVGAIVGGAVGAGAGIGVVSVDTTNTAEIKSGSATQISGASALIAATTEHNLEGAGMVGVAAGGFAVQAAVATFTDNSTTSATLDGGVVNLSGALGVNASDTTSLTEVAGAVGVSFSGASGSAAAGVGIVTKNTTATIGGTANITAGDVTVDAESGEAISTDTIGLGAGGVAGAAGAISVLDLTDTTTAEIGGDVTLLAQDNAAVLANDATSVDSLDGGIAGGGGVALGASIGVAIINSTTHALIDDGAQVTALGKGTGISYISAYDTGFEAYTVGDAFKAPSLGSSVSGSADGGVDPTSAEDAKEIGLALLTQERTSAAHMATSNGVVVNAADSNQLRSLSIGGGVAGALAASLSASVPVVTTDTEARIDGDAQINQGAGTADSRQSVQVAALSDFYDLGLSGSFAAGGLAGAGAGTSVAVVSNTTKALVSDDATDTTHDGKANISAKGDIGVTALASEDFAAASGAGAAAGFDSLAGGVTALALTDVTKAELGGTATANGTVNIVADDETHSAILAGSVAVSGETAVGAAIGVIDLSKTTTADVAASADVTALGNSGSFTEHTGDDLGTTTTASGLNVSANSVESDLSVAVAGTAGLGEGVSGVITLELDTITTTADIGANAQVNATNTDAAAGQDVSVAAHDSDVVLTLDGGFAAGLGAGINGTIDIGIFSNTTDAFIDNGASVTAKGDVFVNALSNRAGDSTVVSGSLAGTVALAAGISIYDYGNGVGSSSDAANHISANGDSTKGGVSLNGVVGDIQGQLQSSQVGDILDGAHGSTDSNVKAAGTTLTNDRATIDVTAADTPAATLAGTSAYIGNATITATTGAVDVQSIDRISTNFTTGVVSAAIGGGLGAGIGVTEIQSGNTAEIVGNGQATVTAASVEVAATTTHTLNGKSIAAAAALGAAAEADVAEIDDNSATDASIAYAAITATGPVAVSASTTRNADAEAVGVAVAGVVGVGVSSATADITGEARAYIGDATALNAATRAVTIGTALAPVGSLTVDAYSGDSAIANATAVAGGIGAAADGALANASVTPLVETFADDTDIVAAGAVLFKANAANSASADASGLAIAAVIAAGGSNGDATVDATVSTDLYNNTTVTADSLELDAWVSRQSSLASDVAAVTAAASGSSGAFVGINATFAEAINNSTAHAWAEDSTSDITNAMTVEALDTTSQYANVDGDAFGVLAAGANIAHATSNTATLATLTNLKTVGGNPALSAGSLSLIATGDDTNTADATSGSGGVIAGSAAEADTSATSDTAATADTVAPSGTTLTPYTLMVAGGITLAATHTSNFGGQVDSTQAAVVGASGATLNHAVDSTVDAHLGNDAVVRANDLSITAQNFTHNFFLGEAAFSLTPGSPANAYDGDDADWNVDSGSGGLVNLPAGSANVTISQTTNASIGNNADVHLLAPVTGVSTLTLEAYNEVIAHEKAKLDSGGLIATAEADVDIEIPTDTATVSFGNNDDIVVDVGDIAAGAWGNTDLDGRSAATTYGLAGAPSGKSYANLNVLNTTNVGTNTRLQATDGIEPVDGSTPSDGTVTLAAGDSPTGIQSNYVLHTTVDLYNKTAIPIDTTPDAQSNLTDNASLLIGSDTATPPAGTILGVNAAGDILLAADRGNISTTAVGTGKDIYLEALAEAASAISHVFGGGDVTFDHHGGSTTNVGAGTVEIDGTVDTGLQRDKTLTISYYEGGGVVPCDASTTVCLITPVDGEIPYTIVTSSGDDSVILARLAQLQTLISQYGQDVVAKAAYANEIAFLEQKLVGLGLGQFDGSGNFTLVPFASGQSPHDALTQKIAGEQTNYATLTGQLGTAVNVLNNDGANEILTIYGPTSGATTHTFAAYVAAVKGDVENLSNFSTLIGSGSGSDATFTGHYNTLVSDISDANTAQASITTLTGDNATAQTAINQAVADIAAHPGDDTNNAADITTINTNLTAIKNNNVSIGTETSTLDAKVGDINTQLGDLVNTSYFSTDAKNALNAAAPNASSSGGDLWSVGQAVSAIDTQFAVSTAQSANTTVETTILNGSGTGSIGVYGSQIDTLGGIISTDQAALPSASTAVPSQPTVATIKLPDVVARLGNISINGTVLEGSGRLEAPGDARILITNNTADTLELQDLSMPTYDAGHLRFNGVLVNSNADIARLNGGGLTPDFSDVTTSLASSRPQIVITSNYNPQSSSFFHSGDPLAAKATQFAPPDIVLDEGDVINNPLGAVNITSAAGDIFINGSINAGSLAILAKNGDFVQSYVNGFDHIGGDPAAFNDPTNPDEAGIGITANGGISISARYLNINSTIQSGIADWTAVLNDTPTLTTSDFSSIGLTNNAVHTAETTYNAALTAGTATGTGFTVTNAAGQSISFTVVPAGIAVGDLEAAILDYKAKIDPTGTNNPDASPIYSSVVGGVTTYFNVKDYLTSSLVGTPEFSIADVTTFKNYETAHTGPGIGDGIYGVISPASNIGVSYNFNTNQYLLDGTEVHGGDIQLFGQIMNTASSGAQLNVLDGFGTINITNTGTIPVVLSELDTGDDPTGDTRGTAGIIDITNVVGIAQTSDPLAPIVTVEHTVYTRVYDSSSGSYVVEKAVQDGTIVDATGAIDYGANPITRDRRYGPDEHLHPAGRPPLRLDHRYRLRHHYRLLEHLDGALRVERPHRGECRESRQNQWSERAEFSSTGGRYLHHD